MIGCFVAKRCGKNKKRRFCPPFLNNNKISLSYLKTFVKQNFAICFKIILMVLGGAEC